MSTTKDLVYVAKCLAAANQRLKAMESRPHVSPMDINRLESQVGSLRKELEAATARIGEAARKQFSAKAEESAAIYEANLSRIQKELQASVRGFNPVGQWSAGMVLNRNDVVTVNGSSYVCLKDGVREKPNAKSANFQLLARRGGAGGGPGMPTGFVSPPSSVGSSGEVGQYSYDTEYYYVCVAPNNWLRTSIASW